MAAKSLEKIATEAGVLTKVPETATDLAAGIPRNDPVLAAERLLELIIMRFHFHRLVEENAGLRKRLERLEQTAGTVGAA